MILYFFLARNIRIVRERAWMQTVQSRGKGPEFWKPYVEEWDVPPRPQPGWGIGYYMTGTVGRYIAKSASIAMTLGHSISNRPDL